MIRKGQNIFNFLEFLYREKGYKNNGESIRMADPFYIEDKEWDKLLEEFNKKYNI